MRAILVFLCSTSMACVGAARAPAPVQDAPSASSASSATEDAEDAGRDVPNGADVTSKPAVPRPSVALAATGPRGPAVAMGTYGKRVCSGHAPPAQPREATCCYPARETLLAPIRAVHPSLRACYEALAEPRSSTSVAVKFHVSAAGDVDEACTEESPEVPVALTRCVLEAIREARYPARSRDDVKLCGLMEVTYPVRFSP